MIGAVFRMLGNSVLEILPRNLFRVLLYINDMIFLIWAKLFYKGNRRTCNLCGRKARRFKPEGYKFPVLEDLHVVGGMINREGICPFCLSYDRERLFYYYLETKTEVFKKKMRVLHFAPEKNIRIKLSQLKNLDYITADINSPWAMVKMDITKIQYADNSFDLVICSHVLEHVPDDRAAMAEIFRVLKPGGWAIVQVPISTVLSETYENPSITSFSQREKHFGQYDHVRIYAGDYTSRLESVGGCVKIVNSLDEFGEEVINKFSLNKEENIFIMEKPL